MLSTSNILHSNNSSCYKLSMLAHLKGLFRERRSSGSEEHEVSRELKTEFMQLWDGLSSNNDKIVVVG